jgi:L-ascorbate metabolism protein UlaG (beta-lactamase superfamily)
MTQHLLSATPFQGPLERRLAAPRSSQTVLHWLGQAGFVMTTIHHRIVIDAYLSDSLARKYRRTATPHDRMMQAPLLARELGVVDLALCTHHHTDHMDAETLTPLAEANPRLRFVIPKSASAVARERIGVGDDRLIALDAGDTIEALPGVVVHALRAAHETLERDDEGHHRFLGYSIETNGQRVFHSGDTIPFPGQIEDVSAIAPDLALLPVNGRPRVTGIAGNLTIAEAISLCEACAIPAMIAHHYGMFAFNTADSGEMDRAANVSAPLRMLRAQLQMEYVLQRG